MPTEAPEGILIGPAIPPFEYIQLSNTLIETMDLISEGEIEGPVSGKWIFSGNLGQIGWSKAIFSGYKTPVAQGQWLRSVYWNELPVLNDLGQFNFQNIDLKYSRGLPNGDILQELANEEITSRPIGTRLYAALPQTFRIINKNCKGVIVNIKIASLSQINSANSNVERTSVGYGVSYRPIFSSALKISKFSAPKNGGVYGKLSATQYIDSIRVDFNLTSFTGLNGKAIDNVGFLSDSDFVGWEILITRSTPDSTLSLLSNITQIDSISELYGSQLSYPNSSIIRSTFDARFFAQIPNRGFECNFIKVQVPANYNPILRTYATGGYGTTNGYWNGTFATGKYWTNNPAWCFYDLITNTRYGLGRFVDNIDVYKFDLYNIAQYCDELVADGFGGLEPRFTCNVWIAQKEEAFKVINDMASIFRGLVYYFNGNLNATQDSPKSPRVVFTNASVENGDFNYSSTSKRTRQSIGIVRYNDPKNFYQPAIEYVEDLDSIRRYGIRELPIVAFGCTSRGQAIRLGRWALYSNNIETETVSFVAGLETNLLRCGDLFEVSDAHRKLKRYGGRTIQISNTGVADTGASIVLDSNIDLKSGVQYQFSLVTPTYYYDPSQVTGLTSNDYSNIYRNFIQKVNFSGDWAVQSGGNSVINLHTGFDSVNYNLSGNPVWSIELGPNSQNFSGNFYFSNQTSDYYRVINIKESDSNKYEVIGLSYYPNKFALVDSGVLHQQQLSPIDFEVTPGVPRNLSLNAYKLNNSNSQFYIQYSFIMDDFSHVSNFQTFVTTGTFGTSVHHPSVGELPNEIYLAETLPPTITNATYFIPNDPAISGIKFTPTYTGVQYFFRVYAYNSALDYYSSGYASGNITIFKNLPINDVIIGGLGLN